MDRTQKQAFIGSLSERIASAKSLVVAHYRGLTVKEMSQLRRQMREAGGEVQVAKNRLAKLAFKGTAFEELSSIMVGPTVLAFSADEIAPSRISQKFADANNKLVIVGGSMNGKVLSAAEVKTISQLPTLDEARAKIIGVLQAPGGQLARVTKAYSEKSSEAAAA
ncbi:MAG: 50S ribosomal protein L10 [Blastochloris viridis]|uniref:Large ribosomal subunit protein uL10 n=1 Tax=Blastochloris viridis TaxID=1079 RepID=A0A6N4RCT4_BLAVI|nr:MAG: 50S ribosomal protein L10 [Blastochloris viridis]